MLTTIGQMIHNKRLARSTREPIAYSMKENKYRYDKYRTKPAHVCYYIGHIDGYIFCHCGKRKSK